VAVAPVSVVDRIAGLALRTRARRGERLGFVASLACTLLFVAGIIYLLAVGVGIWGINIPIAWAFAITDYVWWIAIGMGGTFISAALQLARQPWRSALNRYAETMTVCAVSVSGLFPILHLGRPWFSYWLFVYPNKMALWPQWRSALYWDFVAILAYLIVSILYWYVALLPDLAAVRDRARTRGRQVFYGLLALGWTGEARQWQQHESLSRLLAGIALPLVFSVHSMVALDFSQALLPGWHSTIFPPFFVAGAVYSGIAMVLVLGIGLRRVFGLGDIIGDVHLDRLAKLMLASGFVVAYCYAAELFSTFIGGDAHEVHVVASRLEGPYAWTFWTTLVCNVAAIQPLWSPRVRRSPVALFAIACTVLVGMWLERFMLIATTLHDTFLPNERAMFYPTTWDFVFLFGSVGLFALLIMLCFRLVPVVSIAELRTEAAR